MFTLPPNTIDPGAFSTGSDSPVSIDSSTADAPSTTSPSTGIRSPGRTTTTLPGDHLGHGNVHVDPADPDAGRAGLQADQPPDRVRRPPAGAGLEQAAEQHQGDDGGRDLEVDRRRRRVGQHTRRDRHDGRVGEADAGTDRDQRVHVGGAVAEALPGAAVELRTGVGDDRKGQQQLQQVAALEVEVSHADDHDRHGQRDGDGEPPPQLTNSAACARCSRSSSRPASVSPAGAAAPASRTSRTS